MRTLSLALFAAATSVTSATAAPASARPMSVREVTQNAAALDGREVVVAGWLEQCLPRSCGLYGSAKGVRKRFPYFLSIGASRSFDAFARRAGRRWVVLRVRVHDRCVSDPAADIIAACSDRPSTLEVLAPGAWCQGAWCQPRARHVAGTASSGRRLPVSGTRT